MSPSDYNKGTVTAAGLIRCSCHNTDITMSEFETHSNSQIHRPAEYIFIRSLDISLKVSRGWCWCWRGAGAVWDLPPLPSPPPCLSACADLSAMTSLVVDTSHTRDIAPVGPSGRSTHCDAVKIKHRHRFHPLPPRSRWPPSHTQNFALLVMTKPLECSLWYCAACSEGGELLCCDGCPAAYHTKCLGNNQQEPSPHSEWLCGDCRAVSMRCCCYT